MRGLAPGVDGSLRVPDVAWRLPAGGRRGHRSGAGRSIRHRPHRRPRELRQHGPAAGPAYLFRRRDGHVGPHRQGQGRTGLSSPRLRQGPQEDALRLATVRPVAAGNADRRAQRQGQRLSGGEIRLGAFRQRLAAARCRPADGGARGHRPRRHAADRCRPDLGRGRRGGGRASAGPRGSKCGVAGRALPCQRA